jgi:hypothetical protein
MKHTLWWRHVIHQFTTGRNQTPDLRVESRHLSIQNKSFHPVRHSDSRWTRTYRENDKRFKQYPHRTNNISINHYTGKPLPICEVSVHVSVSHFALGCLWIMTVDIGISYSTQTLQGWRIFWGKFQDTTKPRTVTSLSASNAWLNPHQEFTPFYFRLVAFSTDTSFTNSLHLT